MDKIELVISEMLKDGVPFLCVRQEFVDRYEYFAQKLLKRIKELTDGK